MIKVSYCCVISNSNIGHLTLPFPQPQGPGPCWILKGYSNTLDLAFALNRKDIPD